MKRTLLALSIAGLFTVAAQANHHNAAMDKNSSTTNAWQDTAMDAWIDGKAEATLLFNGNLDSFDINTDVKDGVVTLTGKVDSSVDMKLAEELITGIDGVNEVDNQLVVVESERDMSDNDSMQSLTDAKIATVIKTRLLFDTDISGTDINVDVNDGEVMLKGVVDSSTEKDLVVQIAENATDVRSVSADIAIAETE
ncbi:BON domain-containing protein [Alteromonas flava]|uniref:BON domain-containing protein n=1 Tax=Alteromonas flava TaxID=2048003 RepID=UPI000C293FBE|nr:BON domain-containing protein [Alteromonas flava]